MADGVPRVTSSTPLPEHRPVAAPYWPSPHRPSGAHQSLIVLQSGQIGKQIWRKERGFEQVVGNKLKENLCYGFQCVRIAMDLYSVFTH